MKRTEAIRLYLEEIEMEMLEMTVDRLRIQSHIDTLEKVRAKVEKALSPHVESAINEMQNTANDLDRGIRQVQLNKEFYNAKLTRK